MGDPFFFFLLFFAMFLCKIGFLSLRLSSSLFPFLSLSSSCFFSSSSFFSNRHIGIGFCKGSTNLNRLPGFLSLPFCVFIFLISNIHLLTFIAISILFLFYLFICSKAGNPIRLDIMQMMVTNLAKVGQEIPTDQPSQLTMLLVAAST